MIQHKLMIYDGKMGLIWFTPNYKKFPCYEFQFEFDLFIIHLFRKYNRANIGHQTQILLVTLTLFYALRDKPKLKDGVSLCCCCLAIC